MCGNAFLFTGQGAQYAGMGRDLCENHESFKEIFGEASERLKLNLSEICSDINELSKTQNAQAAIFTVSYGIYKLLRKNNIKPDCAAGFSLGEITSLAAAEVISFADALDLIKVRSEAMRLACERKPGSMYSIIGAEDALVEETCKNINGYVIPANYNCPGQIVISGEAAAAEEAVKIFAEKKIRTVKLNVAGAFHTELMRYREDLLIKFLETIKFSTPVFDIYSNVTGRKFEAESGKVFFVTFYMQDYIPKQMSNPVRFCEILENIEAGGCGTFIEIGAGKVLSGFVKRTCKNDGAKIINIQDSETLNRALELLG
jgi:[acyl-carrier-protein] S-malonyltransferase